jgi:hypothetical protein
MNNNLDDILLLKGLEPRAEVSKAMRERVIGHVHASVAATQPIPQAAAPVLFETPVSTRSPFFALSATVAVLVLIVASNQLPMHGGYNSSVSAVVEAARFAEMLEQSGAAADVRAVHDATALAHEELKKLQLGGVFGVYTQEQCLQAHLLFDYHLDYVLDYLDAQANIEHSVETRMAFEELRAYVIQTRNEVQGRIQMYPDAMR